MDNECLEIAEGTMRPMGELRPAFPTPAGGICMERVSELLATWGGEVILLIGGDLFRGKDGFEATSRRCLETISSQYARIVKCCSTGGAGTFRSSQVVDRGSGNRGGTGQS